MPIDKVYQVTNLDMTGLNNTLDSIYNQSTGTIHTDAEPTAANVPLGKLVIYDNAVDRRVYVRTGKEGVGYFTLTMI